MDSLWVMFLIVWAIVEVIQWLRKKPLRARMKSAAIWSTVLTSVAGVGQMDPRQNALVQLAVCLVMFGVPAAVLYFVRSAISPKPALGEIPSTNRKDM